MANEKQQMFGFQMSSPKKKIDEETEELLQFAEDFVELQKRVASMLSEVETEKEKAEIYKKLDSIETLLKKQGQKKISLLHEKAVEIVVGGILLIMSIIVLSQITHTRDIAGENQTNIGIANARLESAATKEELANLRSEFNTSLNELQAEFTKVNRSLDALVEQR